MTRILNSEYSQSGFKQLELGSQEHMIVNHIQNTMLNELGDSLDLGQWGQRGRRRNIRRWRRARRSSGNYY